MSKDKFAKFDSLTAQMENYLQISDDCEDKYWETNEKIFWNQHVDAMNTYYRLQASRDQIKFDDGNLEDVE